MTINPSPREALAEVLDAERARKSSPRIKLGRLFAKIDRKAWPEVAHRAGLTSRQMVNFIGGQPITANSYLRLCVVLEHDPLPSLPLPMGELRPADLDQVLFALGFRLRRGLNGHTMRKAAELCGCGAATVLRLEGGAVVSIGVVLRACSYIGVHPFGYLRSAAIADVSRETEDLPTTKTESLVVSFTAPTSEAALEGSPGR